MIPALNTVLVTTGGGFDEAEIEGLLFPMLLQSSRPRPASPEGQAALQASLASIQKNESIPAGLSTSEIARVVSGRMYECENNPAGLESLRIDFDDPTVAMVYQKLFSQELVWEVGMDGHYRQSSPDGDALIGYWEDASTFHLEIFDLGTQVYQVKFQGDRLQVISNEADLTIACQAQTP